MNAVLTKPMEKASAQPLRRTAALVGALYILGTAAGMASGLITMAYFGAPDFLQRISRNPNPVILGALFVLVMGLALAMIPVLMYPILKRHNEMLATGYVVFRGALETVTYIATAVCWLVAVTLGRTAVQTGTDAPALQAMGAALTDPKAVTIVTAVFFIAGALMFYALLYRSGLVPRWLSGWGLVAAPPYLAASLLALSGAVNSGTETVLYLPMMLQELVLAVWLIAKGFNPTAATASKEEARVCTTKT